MSAPQKRAAAQHLVESGQCSQRQVCRFLNLSRSSARYQARPRAEEKSLVERLHSFAKRRRRRGYRLAHQELQRGGMVINHKRVHRLWHQEGLTVPPRRSRKRIRGTGKPRLLEAVRPHQVWCLDFLHESTLSGSKMRILCVSDEFTRQSLAIEAGKSFRSEQVCAVLERPIQERGIPEALRMDNGPEFVALALRGLCHRKGINAAYIEPGKPWQNGYAESFHSRLRDEFLDGEVFTSAQEAQVRLEVWRRDWNTQRLHSSLGYLTPHEYAARWQQSLLNQSKTQATNEPWNGGRPPWLTRPDRLLRAV